MSVYTLGDLLRHHGVKGQKWGVKNGPPYPIDHSKTGKTKKLIESHVNKPSAQETLEKSVGSGIIAKATHTSLTGKPNSISQVIHKNGGVDRNYYDENGRQKKQISNNNHGYPRAHKFGKHGEHAHDYVYDDSGKLIGRPIRELTDEERKENGDIL